MDEPKLRLACAKKLRDAGFKLTKKAFSEDAKWSRFFSATQKMDDMTDEEVVHDAAKKLLHKAKAQFPKAEAVFREVFKGMKQ